MRQTIWDEMRRMRKEMDSLFENFFYETPYLLENKLDKKNELVKLDNYREPIFDIEEKEKEYSLNVEIPGAKKEDIKININDNQLDIKVEKKEENKKEDKEKGYYSYSKSYSGYYKTFTLPRNIDKENIDAEYKNGVLNLKIPKKEIENKSKLIEVK